MTKSPVSSQAEPSAARRRVRRYQISAAAVLLFGLVCGGAVYWLGSHGPDDLNDPAMVGFNRSEEQQMGIMYGKQGQLIEDLSQALKEPGVQAILVMVAAAVVAACCFHFARIQEPEAKPGGDASNLPAAPKSD
jgi:hypothetical protein